jgi:heptosyltransferase I
MRERGNKIFKLADKYLGSTLLFLMGIFYDKRKYWAIKSNCSLRIAVIKTGAIGDALLVGSAVSLIKEKWPKAKITFICTDSNAQAAKGLGGVDSIIVFDTGNVIRSLWRLRRLDTFDLLADFAPWARLNGIISYSVKAKYRVGFKTRGMYRHYVYDAQVTHSSKVHELDNYKRILEAIGIEGKLSAPYFMIDQRSLGPMEKLNAEKAVVFHPFPGGAQKHLKSWPEKNWVELGQRLAAEGYQIIISGGSNDFMEADAIAKRIGRNSAVTISGQSDLNQTAYIIKQAGLLVSVDTGTMHLGAAVEARVISLHGPTSPERWGARGANVIALSARLPCSPCISLGFDSKCCFEKCMQAIPVDEVYDMAMKSMNNKNKS